MSLTTLGQTNKRVLMFGGKGGVGTTTSSAAPALHYAQAGRRTLIISSDLTPSLSDIFEAEIGPTEKPLPGVENLYALEIDPDEVMRRWKELAQQTTRFFSDPANVEFVMVTIPEALGVYQSRRVIGELEEHGLHVHLHSCQQRDREPGL
ncbi:MAG: ArsA-related P-loop ATPase [Anaerolineae bacterium]